MAMRHGKWWRVERTPGGERCLAILGMEARAPSLRVDRFKLRGSDWRTRVRGLLFLKSRGVVVWIDSEDMVLGVEGWKGTVTLSTQSNKNATMNVRQSVQFLTDASGELYEIIALEAANDA